MSFPIQLYLFALGGAWLTTVLTMPLWRAWAYRTGLVDDPGHRKIHDQPVALAGGLAVFTGLLVPLLLGALLVAGLASPKGSIPSHALSDRLLGASTLGLLGHGFFRRGLELFAILLGAIGIGFLGWLDD